MATGKEQAEVEAEKRNLHSLERTYSAKVGEALHRLSIMQL